MHRHVLVQGLNVHLHMGAWLHGGCVCSRGPCALAQGLCAHTRGQHTPSPSSLCVPLAQGLARGQDTCPCLRSSGDMLAQGCLCTCAVAGHRLLCSQEGGVRPSHGDVRGDWGGQRWPFTEWDLLHKCAQAGVHAHRGVHALSASVQTHRCACMSAHVCTCSQACVHTLASAPVSFAPGRTLPREVCAQWGGAHRIWRVSGWRGGPWWVQGWWGDMVTGCPGAMVMGRWGARVMGCQGAMVPWCWGARVMGCDTALGCHSHGAMGCQGAGVPRCPGAGVPRWWADGVPGCQGAMVLGCQGTGEPWHWGARAMDGVTW